MPQGNLAVTDVEEEDEEYEDGDDELWDPAEDLKQRQGAAKEAETFAESINNEDLDLITDKVWYVSVIAALAFANVQIFVVETDVGCVQDGCTSADRGPWFAIEHMITAFFLIDIAVRIKDYGPKLFFQGQNALRFNFLHNADFLIVVLRCVDVWILTPVGVNTGLKFLSMFRIIHVGSFVKRVRFINGFRELWLIMNGIGDTMKSVGWVLLLLMLVLWVFAILITIVVGKADDANAYDYRRSSWTMDDYWGSVFKSLYSMFQVMSRDRWSDSLVWPLVRRSGAMVMIFIAFLTITVLALLNTIVGCVVECTISSAKANEEKAGKEKQKQDAKIMESLEVIFQEADADGSGELDQDELHAALKKPNVRDRMRMLDIPYKDLDLLFSLLDEEGTGLIKTETFFRGCGRLRGNAMSSHMYHMSIDFDRSIKWANEGIETCGRANNDLSEVLNVVEDIELEIVQGDGDDADPVLINRQGRTRMNRMEQLRASSVILTEDFSREGTRMSTKESRFPTKNSSLVKAALRSTAVPTSKEITTTQPDEPPPPPPLPKIKPTQPKDPSKQSVRRSVKGWNENKGFQWGTDSRID